MIIERTSFFVAVGSVALGGALGYLAGERQLLRSVTTVGATEQQPPIAHPIEPPAATSEAPAAPAAPVCDDMAGTAAACPGPGYPSEEGQGCGVVPSKRCQDFKQTMKPRVAERAVACLTALPPAQRCDPSRLSLCAHAALMNACPDPEPPLAAGTAPVDELTTRCTSIQQQCAGASFTPSSRDCRATLTGLNAFGRDQIASCMKAHCSDKGLVGCEAVVEVK